MARIVTRFVIGTVAAAVIVAVIFAVLGSTSSGSGTTAAGAPSSGPSAVPSSAPVAAASPSSQICTTHACIASDLDQSLVGLVAQDESVSVKAKCYKKTVTFHRAADTYSATCLVTYSDGSEATGTGNLLMSAQKVTFEPSG